MKFPRLFSFVCILFSSIACSQNEAPEIEAKAAPESEPKIVQTEPATEPVAAKPAVIEPLATVPAKPATQVAATPERPQQTPPPKPPRVETTVAPPEPPAPKPPAKPSDPIAAAKLELSQTEARIRALEKNLSQLSAARKKGGNTADWRIRVATLERSVEEALVHSRAKKVESEKALAALLAADAKLNPKPQNQIAVDTKGTGIIAFKPEKKPSLMDRMTEQTTVDASVFEPLASSISDEELDKEMKRIEEEMVGLFGR